MSAGPITHARRGHVAPFESTADTHRMCARGTGLNATFGTSYCGRTLRKDHVAASWDDVVCTDCLAARHADEAVAS